MDYAKLQKIKSEEYEAFFKEIDNGYYPYLNHLGEIQWMREEDADRQHEFYEYVEAPFIRIKKSILGHPRRRFEQAVNGEAEARLQIRRYLEERYLGQLRPDTAGMMPDAFDQEISEEQIEQIPITIQTYNKVSFNRRILLAIALLAVLLAGAWVIFTLAAPAPTGTLIIASDVNGYSVFLDDVKRAYADFDHTLPDIPPGKYRVTVRKAGYLSMPAFHDVTLTTDSTVTLRFGLRPAAADQNGHLLFSADQPDSKVFVNDQFYGLINDLQVLSLPVGEHTVAVRRAGYISIPEKRLVRLEPNDTLHLSFLQQAAAATRTPSSTRAGRRLGSLEIKANVSGAHIYFDGEDTGKEADHLFTGLPLGDYRISLRKEGYTAIPSTYDLSLSADDPAAEFEFELTKQSENVLITTRPPGADIFVDGKKVGQGRFEGPLSIGSHSISPGKLNGFITPKARSINLIPNQPQQLTLTLFPETRLQATVKSDGNLAVKGFDLSYGYTQDNFGFTPSTEVGPEVVFNDLLQAYVWKLGFAFRYRDPTGNDALRLQFALPKNLNPGQRFVLKFSGAASREQYPMDGAERSHLQIKVNGRAVSEYLQPQFVEEIGQLEEYTVDVSSLIRPGQNIIEMGPTSKNRCFFLLKSILLQN